MTLLQRLASLSLRSKLIILLILSTLAIIVVVSAAAIQYGQGPTSQILVEQLTRDRLQDTSNVLKNGSDVAASLSNDQTILSAYSDLIKDNNNQVAERAIEDAFRFALNRQPTIRQFRFVSLQGRILASVPGSTGGDDSAQPYYQALKGRVPSVPTYDVYLGDVVNADTAPNMDFVGTSVSGANPLGYIVVNVDLTGAADPHAQSMYSALKGIDTPLGAVNFYLLSADNALISPAQRVGAAKSVELPASVAHPSLETAAVVRVTSPLTAQPAFDFSLPVPSARLALVGEIPILSFGINSDTQRFVIPILLIAIVCLVVLFIFGLFLDTTIARPVLELRALVREAVEGRMQDVSVAQDPTRAPIQQQDELGQIYRLFSENSRNVQHDIQALEMRVRQRTRDVEASREIGQALSNIREIDPLLQAVANLIRQHFSEIQHAQVYLSDNLRHQATLRVSTRDGGKAAVINGERILLDEPTAVTQAIVDGHAHVALDTQAQANLSTFLPGTRSELALPLSNGAEMLGALDLQSQHVDAFAESDVSLFTSIANQLTIAIYNAKLFEESLSRLAQIEELNSRLIGEGWRNFSLKRRRVPAASSGEPNGQAAEDWTPLQQKAVSSGALVEQVNEDTVTFAVPVSLRGEALGAVEFDVPRSAYTENTRQLARELATRLAVSADSARLFEESQRSAQREHLVNEIASRLTQQTNVEEILQTAVREIGQALHVPEASIRLATAAERSRKDTL